MKPARCNSALVGKGDKPRHVLLPADVAKDLRTMRSGASGSARVFPITERRINYILKAVAKRAGISPNTSPHRSIILARLAASGVMMLLLSVFRCRPRCPLRVTWHMAPDSRVIPPSRAYLFSAATYSSSVIPAFEDCLRALPLLGRTNCAALSVQPRPCFASYASSLAVIAASSVSSGECFAQPTSSAARLMSRTYSASDGLSAVSSCISFPSRDGYFDFGRLNADVQSIVPRHRAFSTTRKTLLALPLYGVRCDFSYRNYPAGRFRLNTFGC